MRDEDTEDLSRRGFLAGLTFWSRRLLATNLIGPALAAGLILSFAETAKAAEPVARPAPNMKIEPDDAEPVKCFKLAWESEGKGGLGLPMGMAVDLCGGTRSAQETLKCFDKAYAHRGNDGLGLPLGMAVRLCRTNPARE
jgi:hypothetical protein